MCLSGWQMSKTVDKSGLTEGETDRYQICDGFWRKSGMKCRSQATLAKDERDNMKNTVYWCQKGPHTYETRLNLNSFDLSSYMILDIFKSLTCQSQHKMAFSRNTNLSVGKYSGIITLKASFDEFLSAVGIDGVLRWVHVKHIVIREGLVLSQNHLGFARGHKCADVTSLNLFFCQLRTNPVTQRERNAIY